MMTGKCERQTGGEGNNITAESQQARGEGHKRVEQMHESAQNQRSEKEGEVSNSFTQQLQLQEHQSSGPSPIHRDHSRIASRGLPQPSGGRRPQLVDTSAQARLRRRAHHHRLPPRPRARVRARTAPRAPPTCWNLQPAPPARPPPSQRGTRPLVRRTRPRHTPIRPALSLCRTLRGGFRGSHSRVYQKFQLLVSIWFKGNETPTSH